jgi:RluA family pseudouridine synthase
MQRERLYKFITSYIKEANLEYTTPEIKRNITQFGVFINDKLQYEHLFWIYDNIDEIKIDHWPKRKDGDFDSIQTIYENNDFFVINKPANVVVEAGAGNLHNNLVSYYKKEFNQDIYPAHRLDKDTSGLLLIAKTRVLMEELQEEFRNRRVEKAYLTVVKGLLNNKYKITNWQTKDKSNMQRQKFFWTEKKALEYDLKAKKAISIITPLIQYQQDDQEYTIVQVTILTGRMHQIRLQLESLGYPIINDTKYNQNSIVQTNNKIENNYKILSKRTKIGLEYYKEKIESGDINKQNQDLAQEIKDNLINLPLPNQIDTVTKVSKHVFYDLANKIFSSSSFDINKYYLLSNYLKFNYKDINYEFELVNIEKLLYI